MEIHFVRILDHVNSQSLSGVSWIYRGTAQQNNSALTFNLYDTLNLVCRASVDQTFNSVIFAVSKGSIPTTMTLSSAGALSIANVGTLIWSDVDGVKSGYENFNIYGSTYNGQMHATFIYDYRFVNVGTLKTTDSGTYHCSAAYITDNSATAVKTSGGLTITVNTQSGQAHSSRTGVNHFLTYSAAILGATKLVL